MRGIKYHCALQGRYSRLGLLLVPVVLFVLAGCATMTDYKPPVAGPVAQLSVPKFTSSYKLLGGFSGGAVQISEKQADGCAGPIMKIPLNKSGSGQSIAVAAEKDIFITVYRYWGNTNCKLSGLVKLQSGGSYHVNFGTAARSCFFSVKKAGGGAIKLRQAKAGAFKLCAS